MDRRQLNGSRKFVNGGDSRPYVVTFYRGGSRVLSSIGLLLADHNEFGEWSNVNLKSNYSDDVELFIISVILY